MKIHELRDRLAETDLEEKIVTLARIRDWMVHHDRGDYRRAIAGDPGFPDLVLSRHGVTVFAELKAAKGRLSRSQCEWLGAITDTDPLEWRSGSITASRLGAAVEVYVWRPTDWPRIEDLLR
jgi:hypothetical protein